MVGLGSLVFLLRRKKQQLFSIYSLNALTSHWWSLLLTSELFPLGCSHSLIFRNQTVYICFTKNKNLLTPSSSHTLNTTQHSLKSLLLSQSKNFVIILLLLSLGSGSITIQVLGWATMIPTKYAESGSMSQAIDETFSGDYPCSMCELAARKRAAEQPASPTAPNSEKKSKKSQKLIIFSHKMICIYPPKLDAVSYTHLTLPTTPYV